MRGGSSHSSATRGTHVRTDSGRDERGQLPRHHPASPRQPAAELHRLRRSAQRDHHRRLGIVTVMSGHDRDATPTGRDARAPRSVSERPAGPARHAGRVRCQPASQPSGLRGQRLHRRPDPPTSTGDPRQHPNRAGRPEWVRRLRSPLCRIHPPQNCCRALQPRPASAATRWCRGLGKPPTCSVRYRSIPIGCRRLVAPIRGLPAGSSGQLGRVAGHRCATCSPTPTVARPHHRCHPRRRCRPSPTASTSRTTRTTRSRTPSTDPVRAGRRASPPPLG